MAREALEFGSDLNFLGFRGMTTGRKACTRKPLLSCGTRQPGRHPFLAHLGNTYARAGRGGSRVPSKAEGAIEVTRAYSTALIHAGLGEKDEAFDWLEGVRTTRQGWPS
jgi:hypothetical protein